MKVKERFFLDGINMRGTHARVHQRIVCPATIFANTAVAALPIGNYAPAGTQSALDNFA